MSNNLKGSHAQRTLAAPRLRLQKCSESGKPQWKICNPRTPLKESLQKTKVSTVNKDKESDSINLNFGTLPFCRKGSSCNNISEGVNPNHNHSIAVKPIKPEENKKFPNDQSSCRSPDPEKNFHQMILSRILITVVTRLQVRRPSSGKQSAQDKENNENEIIVRKKNTRKRKAVPSEWKRNYAKRLRNTGKAYKTLGKGLEMPERILKPPCNDKCKQRCTTKFTEEERLVIFKNYWKMADIVKQRVYICTLIEEINPKYRYTCQIDGRLRNHAFHFFKDNKKIKVCKHFFVATLGITNRCIHTVKDKIKSGTLGVDNRGKHANHREVSKDIKDSVRLHISSIPTIESHYTRAHSEKVYIEGSKTIAQLHRDYKSECEDKGKPYANLTLYRKIFNYEFNIAFFVPKKDQCQTCVSYQNSSEDEKKVLEKEYNSHIEEKNLSRDEKAKEKSRISSLFQVACYDLQAALPTPNGQVSSFYYRSKLSTYNFTVCDVTQNGQGPVNCYMWHEGVGKRGANEIGTCLLMYLKEKADTCDNDDLEITFYSDNCAGQQKNKFVISAFLYAVAIQMTSLI